MFRRRRAEAQERAAVAAAERDRRARYWFQHPDDFQCDVVVCMDHDGPSIGAFAPGAIGNIGLYASIPTRTNGAVDRGPFRVAGTGLTVLGQKMTWVWDVRSVFVACAPDRIELRAPNAPVVTLLGPVWSAVAGAAVHHAVPGWEWAATHPGVLDG
jgi:hypothetical protein